MQYEVWRRSPISEMIAPILGNQESFFRFKLYLTIHAEGYDYPVYRVNTQHISRDYAINMMDDHEVNVDIPMGDYMFKIYPHKENLEISIKKDYLNPINGSASSKGKVEIVRYKAILDPSNPSTESSSIGNATQQSLNLNGFKTFKFKLYDRNVEPLRSKMVEGVYHDVDSESIIKGLLYGESQKMLIDGKPAVSGLDVVPLDNNAKIKHVLIDSGVYVCEIPTILQTKVEGVYKNGIGTYYQRVKQRPTWFVYPLYDFERFEKSKDKDLAIFYLVPPKFLFGIETTYKYEKNLLEVIVNTNSIHVDKRDVDQLNGGVGFRLMDRNAVMKKPVELDSDNTPLASRARLNNEVNFTKRKDGLNISTNIINQTTNVYHETSKVSERLSNKMQLEWTNADESLIYPGMPCKVYYVENNKLNEIRGCILGVHAFSKRLGIGGEQQSYATSCMVAMSLERSSILPKSNPGDEVAFQIN